MVLQRGEIPREVTLRRDGGPQSVQPDNGGAGAESTEGREWKLRQGGQEIFAGHDGRGRRGGYTKSRGEGTREIALRRGGVPREVTLLRDGRPQRVQPDGGGAGAETAEGRVRKFWQRGQEIFAGHDGQGLRGGVY